MTIPEQADAEPLPDNFSIKPGKYQGMHTLLRNGEVSAVSGNRSELVELAHSISRGVHQ
jgi:hydroxyethylthiazole kinase-like sugar kinase family protein